MAKSSRKKRYTFMVSMVAGLGLLFGVVHIFDVPAQQLFDVLWPILMMVIILIVFAFLLGTLLSLFRHRRNKG